MHGGGNRIYGRHMSYVTDSLQKAKSLKIFKDFVVQGRGQGLSSRSPTTLLCTVYTLHDEIWPPLILRVHPSCLRGSQSITIRPRLGRSAPIHYLERRLLSTAAKTAADANKDRWNVY